MKLSIFIITILLSVSASAQSRITPQTLINKAVRVSNDAYNKAYNMNQNELERAFNLLNQASSIINGRGTPGDISLRDISCVSRKRFGSPYVLAYKDRDFNLVRLTGISFTFESDCKEVLEKNVRRASAVYFCSSVSQNGSPYAVYRLNLFSRPSVTRTSRNTFSFESECLSSIGLR